MLLGDFQLTTVPGGRFWLDGGAMFGIVPAPLWSKVAPCDDRNRIPLATNCVLVDTGSVRALIDTGFGSKLGDKQCEIHGIVQTDALFESLGQLEIDPGDIDLVILSHLHFDHAGGGTRRDVQGMIRPSFPNAEYVIQRREWEAATGGRPEWAAAYMTDDFPCLADSGQLRLIDGEEEITPGVVGRWTGGHSPGHQVIQLTSGGETAIYLGDLCPTWNHLRTMWCMAYDEHLVEVRRHKPRLLGQIADESWYALSDHDPRHAAVRLERDPRREFQVAEAWERL